MRIDRDLIFQESGILGENLELQQLIQECAQASRKAGESTLENWFRPNPKATWEVSGKALWRVLHEGKDVSDIRTEEGLSNCLVFHTRNLPVHPVNGEVPPVKGRPWKLPHYANRGKTSSSGGELASARSCFSTVRTALGKLRITGLLARFDVARSFPQFPRPLLLQPTIWTSERGADLGSGRCQPRPHLPIYRMTQSSWICGRRSGAFATSPCRSRRGVVSRLPV